MATAVIPNADILPGVFAPLWGIERGGVGDYRVVAEQRVRCVDRRGGAGISAILLLEFDENVWDAARVDQLETYTAHGGAAWWCTRLGRFASATDETEKFGIAKCLYAVAPATTVFVG